MRIVVADDLPASALELIRAEPGWVVDARPGRTPAALAADLADADGLLVRSATTVDARLMDAAPSCASSRAPGPAWTTSMWPPPVSEASSSSTRPARTASA